MEHLTNVDLYLHSLRIVRGVTMTSGDTVILQPTAMDKALLHVFMGIVQRYSSGRTSGSHWLVAAVFLYWCSAQQQR